MSLNLEQALGGNFSLNSAAIGIGSGNNTLATTAALNYVIGGVFATQKSITAAITVPAPGTTVPTTVGAGAVGPVIVGDGVTRPIAPGQKAAFGLWIDASGTFHITQSFPTSVGDGGVTQAVADSANFGPFGPWALVGVAVVYTNSTTTFTPGTTAFNAAGVTTAYYNTMSIPADHSIIL